MQPQPTGQVAEDDASSSQGADAAAGDSPDDAANDDADEFLADQDHNAVVHAKEANGHMSSTATGTQGGNFDSDNADNELKKTSESMRCENTTDINKAAATPTEKLGRSEKVLEKLQKCGDSPMLVSHADSEFDGS